MRWALSLKDVDCTFAHVNLLEGEQRSEAHVKRNPMGLVPCLEITDKEGKIRYLAESTAIIEWLDERFKTPPLLPGDEFQRARLRQLAQVINAGIQPIQNLQVLKFHSASPDERKNWATHWIKLGFTAYETLVSETAGLFSFGDSVTLPDLFLIPQVYNAKRFDVDLKPYPLIQKINDNALITDTCQASHPDRFNPT